jgi:hypothetical protein
MGFDGGKVKGYGNVGYSGEVRIIGSVGSVVRLTSLVEAVRHGDQSLMTN